MILQALALNIVTVEPTADSYSEEAYRNIISAYGKLGIDEGKENFWNEFSYEPRTLDKIQYMEKVFSDKIWYQYHLGMRYRVENGLESVDPAIWESALKAGETVVAKYGAENPGPYSEFEWGMLHRNLSALQ